MEGGAPGGLANLNVDPRFVDPGEARDLHLAEGSPCVDAALLSNGTHDLDRARRSGVRDIGADEPRRTAATAPPTA